MIKRCKNIFSKIISARVKPDQMQDIASTSLQVPHAKISTNVKKKQDVIILLELGAAVVIRLSLMKYGTKQIRQVILILSLR